MSAVALFTLLVILLAAGLSKPLDQEVVDEIESKMIELEQKSWFMAGQPCPIRLDPSDRSAGEINPPHSGP